MTPVRKRRVLRAARVASNPLSFSIHFASGLVALFGCYSDEENKELESSDDVVAIQNQPILSGYLPAALDPAADRVVNVDNGNCSGVKINDSWVLTAAHCGGETGPEVHSLKVRTSSTEINSTFFFRHPNANPPGVEPDLGYDVALIKLGGSLGPSSTPLMLSLVPPSNGDVVRAYGYGQYTVAPGSGGFLAYADVPVIANSGAIQFRTGANGLGQIQGHGDSGGPVYQYGKLVGVTRGGELGANADSVSTAHFANWVSRTMAMYLQQWGAGYKSAEQLCVYEDQCKLGDVNGDGKKDLIAFSRGEPGWGGFGDVWVALSDGTTFGTPYKAHDQLCVYQDTCKVGDVNGDNRDDIIAFSRGGAGWGGFGDVWVALSNGTTFSAGYKAHEQLCVYEDQCEVGDVDGDGKDDILAFSRGEPGWGGYGDVWAARSNGTTFTGAYLANPMFCVAGEECRVGDINGDGKVDIISFLRGNPGWGGHGDVWVATSNFVAGVQYFSGAFKAHDLFCEGDDICRVADLNNDGEDDLIAFHRGSVGDPKYGDVRASFSHAGRLGPSQLIHSQMCVGGDICEVGDISNDGHADLVAFQRGTSAMPNFGDVWTAKAIPNYP